MRSTFASRSVSCRLAWLALLLLASPLPSFGQASPEFIRQLGLGMLQATDLSADGSMVLTGSADGVARLWDAKTGELLREFKGHTRYLTLVSFSKDMRTILTGSYDGTARLWNTATGERLQSFSGDFENRYSAALSPDGSLVLTAGLNKDAQLWDSSSGALQGTFTGHSTYVSAVAFSVDGKKILTSSGLDVKLWDIDTTTPLRSFPVYISGPDALALSPDGSKVLAVSGSQAYLWDAATGQRLWFINYAKEPDIFNSVSFLPNGSAFLIGGIKARLIDTQTQNVITNFAENLGQINSVSLSADGSKLLTGITDQTARLWDVATGAPLQTISGHSEYVQCARFSPDGNLVMTGGLYGLRGLKLWDARTGTLARYIQNPPSEVTGVAFSPDGKNILTIGGDYIARLWDVETLDLIRSFPNKINYGWPSVAFAPDGKTILTCSDVVRHWNVATGELLTTYTAQNLVSVSGVAFSPKGDKIRANTNYRVSSQLSYSAITEWQLKPDSTEYSTSYSIGSLAGIYDMAFSPDDNRVLVADTSGKKALLFPLQPTIAPDLIISGHTGEVHSVAFSPDGGQILTGDTVGNIYIWDAVTRLPITSFTGHAGAIMAIAFAPDGKKFLTAGSEGTVKLWYFQKNGVKHWDCYQ